MSRRDEPNDFHLVRIVSERRVGNLVGKVKEQLEASIQDKEQRTALKNLVTDVIYDWFGDIGDKLSEKEADEAMHVSWGMTTDGRYIAAPDHDLGQINWHDSTCTNGKCDGQTLTK